MMKLVATATAARFGTVAVAASVIVVLRRPSFWIFGGGSVEGTDRQESHNRRTEHASLDTSQILKILHKF